MKFKSAGFLTADGVNLEVDTLPTILTLDYLNHWIPHNVLFTLCLICVQIH